MITQQKFLDLIVPRYESKIQAFEAIGNVLNITPSAVRKIVSGSTELTYSRLSHLLDHYQIRPEQVFSTEGQLINARYISLNVESPNNYMTYMRGLLDQLKVAASQPEVRILFAADEIPIFHFMSFKRLAYFKLYAYGYNMLKYDYSFEEIERELDSIGLSAIFEEMVQLYGQIDCIEIWDDYIIDSLCDQIHYLRGVDAFSDPATVDALLGELQSLIQGVEHLCNVRKKSAGGKFRFFQRRSRISPGYMLMEREGGAHLTIKLASINSVLVDNESIIREMHKNFFAALDMSTPFGTGVKREQKQYFRMLIKNIHNYGDRIKTGFP